MKTLMSIALMTTIMLHKDVGAQVVEYENQAEWEAAAGAFTTIDFTGFPNLTFITDQYMDLGLLFTDGDDTIAGFDPNTFIQDGWGVDGDDAVILEAIRKPA